MLKKIEIFAEKIVDYFESKKKKQVLETSDNQILEETLDKISYEIIPYQKNEFDSKVFLKFLNKFSYYSQRINFYIVWNRTSWSLIISLPENLQKKFITHFYNYFPSSKLKKIDFKEPKLDKYVWVNWDDYIQFSKSEENNFFNETFFLFKDIPSNSIWVLRYSLIIHSVWDESSWEYETLLEIIWKGIKLLIYLIYYFFYRLFIWKKPELQNISSKQKIETWIQWTAISIWLWWHENIKSFYNYINSKTKSHFYIKDEEFFSAIKLSSFSKMFYVPITHINQLEYINYKRLSPPSNLSSNSDDITCIGYVDWSDDRQVVWIKQEDKLRHVYIMWKTWVWKSTLLSNMILSDIEQNRSLALIDPHGDLVETILHIIPENRKDDIVLFDVSDTKHIPWFNIFKKNDDNVDLSVSTTLSIFKKLYGNSWGPRLEYIFRNVLFALSEYENANFLHILKMLTDKKFRKKVLTYVKDPVIKDFWEKEFAKRSERFSSEAISPIMNKVWQFVSSSIVRNIFWQQKSTISIKDVMDWNKILLVNLSKWLIWEDNSTMIWSFIVSQIQLETMKRAAIPINKRKNFTLYIDEFQNFVTDSFSTILSEARKYNLWLVVANQYISQLDTKVQNSIFWNVWNIICFNSWNEDAQIISKQFKNQVTVNDILSIPKFKAYTKIMIDWTSTNVFWINTSPIDETKVKDSSYVKEIRKLSNEKYTLDKDTIVTSIGDMMSNADVYETKWEKEKKWKTTCDWKFSINWQKEEIKNTKPTKNQEKNVSDDSSVGDVFKWKIKLKFNYWLFVQAWLYEGLLHKKNIYLPEWINWKDYFSIGDDIQVKMIELKEVDWQKKAVWEYK